MTVSLRSQSFKESAIHLAWRGGLGVLAEPMTVVGLLFRGLVYGSRALR